MAEDVFRKIIRKTGRKPSDCKCQVCKNQCRTPCLGTPKDIKLLIDKGYKDFLTYSCWMVGLALGKLNYCIPMVQPIQTNEGWCIFYKDGLCELHEPGLKPTEGKLSHHTITAENYVFKKGLSYQVAKEWLSVENEKLVKEILDLYNFKKG